MRTTIEMTEAQRAILLRLAAERGERGFSRLVGEAIDTYVATLGPGRDRLEVGRLRGALSEDDARELESRVRALRESWR
jgi:hypothetical protein